MPNFLIPDWSVVHFIPRRAAAPEGPPMECPLVMNKEPVPISILPAPRPRLASL
jgi:hypothetical protein